MKQRIVGIGLVTLLLMLVSQPAWAARTRFHDAAESLVYKEKMGGMIGRGLLNVITSPVDLLVNVVKGTQAGPPLIGTLTGIGKGVGCGALRAGSGIVDVATFWVPGFNGFPVSDSYDDCMAGLRSSAAIQQPVLEPETIALEVEPFIESQQDSIAQTPAPAEPVKKVWKK